MCQLWRKCLSCRGYVPTTNGQRRKHPKLAGVRPSAGPARRRHPVVDAGSDRHVGGRGRRQAWKAAAVLRGCPRNRADAPPDLSPAPSSDGGRSAVDLRDVVPRPVRARSHDSLTAWPAPRPCPSPPPRGLFAGVTLKGSTIKAHRDGNERFYGNPFGFAQLVLEGEAATPHDADAVARWRAMLATAWRGGWAGRGHLP